MNCPACNHNVNPAAKFCTQCGQPLTDAVPVAAAAPPVTATLKAHTSGYIQSVRDAIIRPSAFQHVSESRFYFALINILLFSLLVPVAMTVLINRIAFLPVATFPIVSRIFLGILIIQALALSVIWIVNRVQGSTVNIKTIVSGYGMFISISVASVVVALVMSIVGVPTLTYLFIVLGVLVVNLGIILTGYATKNKLRAHGLIPCTASSPCKSASSSASIGSLRVR